MNLFAAGIVQALQPASISGLLTLLSSVVLPSNAANHDFLAIPQDGIALALIGDLWGVPGAGAGAFVQVEFNGDTAAHYTVSEHETTNAFPANGHSVSTGNRFAGTLGKTGYTVDTGGSGSFVAWLPGYANTTRWKHCLSHGSAWDALANHRAGIYTTAWRTTAAITQIRVRPATGQLGAGSTISLYKIGTS